MFPRTILRELREWKESPFRKPLVLRGARQTGKTCAVNVFANDYRQFIAFNLILEFLEAAFYISSIDSPRYSIS